jgi:hypothetical protein
MRPTPQASRRTATVAAIAVVVGATFTASATGAYARPVRAVAVASSDPAAIKAARSVPESSLTVGALAARPTCYWTGATCS